MSRLSLKRILVKIRRGFRNLTKTDWNNPVNILILLAVLLLPFVAKQYVMTGLLLGILLALSVLWTVDYLPNWVKKLIKENPILSDFLLSTIALFGVGSLFGQGLVLALGAIFCGLILNWAIPAIVIKPV